MDKDAFKKSLKYNIGYLIEYFILSIILLIVVILNPKDDIVVQTLTIIFPSINIFLSLGAFITFIYFTIDDYKWHKERK